jgi:hypothetical protein
MYFLVAVHPVPNAVSHIPLGGHLGVAVVSAARAGPRNDRDAVRERDVAGAVLVVYMAAKVVFPAEGLVAQRALVVLGAGVGGPVSPEVLGVQERGVALGARVGPFLVASCMVPGHDQQGFNLVR